MRIDLMDSCLRRNDMWSEIATVWNTETRNDGWEGSTNVGDWGGGRLYDFGRNDDLIMNGLMDSGSSRE